MNPESTTAVKVKSFFTANIIGAAIIGLIIGFLIGVYYGKNANMDKSGDMTMIDKDAASTTNPLTVKTGNVAATVTSVKTYSNVTSAASASTKNEVSVSDAMAGNSVVINSVSLNNTYWVAIRDNSGDVKNPYILGARRLQSGTTKNVVISLSRKTEANKKYEIVIYKSTGEAFNYDASNLVATLGTISVK